MRFHKKSLSVATQSELWSRWRAGDSVAEISRQLGFQMAQVRNYVVAQGGIAHPPRKRRSTFLSLEEREDIRCYLEQGLSFRAIAKRLQRSPSTISREVARNGGRNHYRACKADALAWERARRKKPCRLAQNKSLAQVVSRQLKKNWSPEQIAGWLKIGYPNDESMRVSHETIYKSLFVQTKGALKRELVAHLRSQRAYRRARKSTLGGKVRGQIRNAVSIRERPPEVEDRAVPGHWEGDLITGPKHSHIATLVERHSRFVMLVKIDKKNAEYVSKKLASKMKHLPAELKRSLTWDRGMEMADHANFTLDTQVQVYFCDPKSPWQRGTNENTNRLLRQYFPKGTELSQFSQAHLNKVAKEMNERPRKTLGFRTPAATLNKALL